VIKGRKMSAQDKVRNIGIVAHIDSGKAQPLSSLVLTPDGWQTIGSLQVGGLVITPSGDHANIIGVYPQGEKDIYTITFHDGSQAECCLDHLWKVRWGSLKENILSTKALLEYLEQRDKPGFKGRPQPAIPLVDALPSPEADLPIHPYVLGVLLGDGGLTDMVLRSTTVDEFVVNKVLQHLPSGVVLKKYAHKEHRIKDEEFIPEIYKRGSIDQRWQLIQGLFDADGTVSRDPKKKYKGSWYSLSTTSCRLVSDVKEVLQSLGCIVSVSKCHPWYTHKGEKKKGRTAYELRVAIQHPKSLFSLPRKKDLCPEIHQGGQQMLGRRVVSIHLKGKEEAQCIAIDHPEQLYVTNDYIVTHNTTTTERILKLSGRIRTMGEVHDGAAEMDFDPQERARGITIGSAVTHFNWNDHSINLIDTPGHVDFTAEVERSLRVLDGAVLVIDSVAGAQAQSETVTRQMNKYNVSRIVFINKMDRVGADFHKAVLSVRARLYLNAHAIQIPLAEGKDFCGKIDLVCLKQINYPEMSDDPADCEVTEIEDKYLERVLVARQALLEALANYSDELLEILLEEQEPPVGLVKEVMRKATCSGEFVPVLLGSSLRNRGVPSLLDAVVDYLPSPVDKGAVVGHHPQDETDKKSFLPVPEAPLGALVFKTVHFSTGDLTFVRVYSGTFKPGDQLYNPRLGKTERVGRLFLVHADSKEVTSQAEAGQIVAVQGLKLCATGDTLCKKIEQIVYGATTFAAPVISQSIETKSSGDRDRLIMVLGLIAREDPTFHTFIDKDTGELIISGMGELHLEVIVKRIETEFKVLTNTGKPRVAYKKTFDKAATIECRFKKQTGGKGMFAVAKIIFDPIKGDDFEYEDVTKGGKIPKEYSKALMEGIRDALLSGGSDGIPIQGVRATVIDGAIHDVDSSQMAFNICGHMSVDLAIKACSVILLEPIMAVEITVPEDYLGAVIGDINSRRGMTDGIEDEHTNKLVKAKIPLAELSAYSTTLRSITSGRGDYVAEPYGYQRAPEQEK
jgi:elongation factor G